MSDKYIKEFSEATTPNSTDALLIDQGLGAYKYCQIANLLKGVNVSGMGTLGCGAITSSGDIILSTDNKGIVSNTADGADNKRVLIGGGGEASRGRGSFIRLVGNEYAEKGRATYGVGLGSGGVNGYHLFANANDDIVLELGTNSSITNKDAKFAGKIETTSTAVDSIKTAGGVSVAGDIAKTSTVTDTSITASSTQVFVDNRAITARHYEEWTIVTSASNTLRSIHKAYVYRRDSTTVSGYVVEILDTYGTQDCTFTNNGDGTFDLSFVNGQAFSVNLSASMIIRSQG